MKTENIRVYLRDVNGDVITFERFSGTLKTAKKKMHFLLSNDLYNRCIGSVHSIEYYSVTNNRIDKLLLCESV